MRAWPAIFLTKLREKLTAGQLLIGFLLAVIIGIAAYRVGVLSKSGTWAAVIMGGLIFGIGGIKWAALLLTFFISSSLLSRIFMAKKSSVVDKFSKSSHRDWAQVLANGGIGMVLVVIYGLILQGARGESFVHQDRLALVWVAYAGSLAAVTADTWATELGILSSTKPRIITTGKPAPTGTSGAVSWLGILASISGALLIGIFAALLGMEARPGIPDAPLLVFIVALGGVCGSVFDSILGATRQAVYQCPVCNKETERHPLHTCGARTTQTRGWNWLNNDLVNFWASIVGALIAIGIGS